MSSFQKLNCFIPNLISYSVKLISKSLLLFLGKDRVFISLGQWAW